MPARFSILNQINHSLWKSLLELQNSVLNRIPTHRKSSLLPIRIFMKPRSIDENPFADLKLNLLQRKIIPSYNETLRACFTVVKSNFLKILHISLKFSKESGCLYIVTHFQKMKKLQFLKADDYMKTITSSLNSNLSAVNLAVSFIAASCPVKSSSNVELSYMLLLNY